MLEHEFQELAEIWVGAVIKRYMADRQTEYCYKVLTLKSFNANGWINQEDLDDMCMTKELDGHYRTKANDIIIRLSSPHTAIVIDKSNEGLVITSAFARITNIDSTLLPHYLAFVLNSETYRSRYLKDTPSLQTMLVKVGTLRQLSMEVPSLERQERIAELNRLWIQERQLEQLLSSARENERLKIQQELLQKDGDIYE